MADIGILTKNYIDHLDKAIESCASVTFCSHVRWVAATDAFSKGEIVELYFVVDGGTGIVKYQGRLSDILLDPVQGTSAVDKLLANAADEDASEGLQNGVIKTLYTVSNLRKLQESFSQTKLLKRSDGKPVSEAYDRAYCIVYQYEKMIAE
jgi:hypothetical protein